MLLSELMSFLELVLERQNILGMDVCGECDMDSCSEDFLNDHANEAILRLWEKMQKSSERMGSGMKNELFTDRTADCLWLMAL